MMRVSLLLKDDDGNIFEGEVDLKPGRVASESTAAQRASAKLLQPLVAPSGRPRTATEALRIIHQKNVFITEREFKAVEDELAKMECNFPKPSLAKALDRADFLTRHGKRGSYRWIQKYPPGS